MAPSAVETAASAFAVNFRCPLHMFFSILLKLDIEHSVANANICACIGDHKSAVSAALFILLPLLDAAFAAQFVFPREKPKCAF